MTTFQYASRQLSQREAGVFACIFRKQEGQFFVLLQKRLCDTPKGSYGIRELPGGGIQDQDFSLNQALYREVQEEIMLDISNIIYHKSESIVLMKKSPIALFFLEVPKDVSIDPRDTEEACDARFFSLELIRQEMLSEEMRMVILPKIEKILPQL